jgi:hypothetical protein
LQPAVREIKAFERSIAAILERLAQHHLERINRPPRLPHNPGVTMAAISQVMHLAESAGYGGLIAVGACCHK